MIMLLIMVLGTSWAVVNAVTQSSRNTLSQQQQNGDVLRLTKNALLGYSAQQASTSDVPGSFPRPEAAGSIGTNSEGTPNALGCASLPAIGRLPWKTLGIEKPLDGAGEVLRYVVGSNVKLTGLLFGRMVGAGVLP
jgi:hypothetical protein